MLRLAEMRVEETAHHADVDGHSGPVARLAH
jgi:hypothetical protein